MKFSAVTLAGIACAAAAGFCGCATQGAVAAATTEAKAQPNPTAQSRAALERITGATGIEQSTMQGQVSSASPTTVPREGTGLNGIELDGRSLAPPTEAAEIGEALTAIQTVLASDSRFALARARYGAERTKLIVEGSARSPELKREILARVRGVSGRFEVIDMLKVGL